MEPGDSKGSIEVEFECGTKKEIFGGKAHILERNKTQSLDGDLCGGKTHRYLGVLQTRDKGNDMAKQHAAVSDDNSINFEISKSFFSFLVRPKRKALKGPIIIENSSQSSERSTWYSNSVKTTSISKENRHFCYREIWLIIGRL
ncbi:unnamed protein product [Vicia faba]|uniref:Uncharacterized protein n=1 Tax=Vicia faba TaxID=3906 RepID=A0AAV1A2C3_VICFA|nr:unnamed protein product [Vicia faba]